MADIDIVLERLVTDTAFRVALTDDPAGALRGYDLSAQDIELLAGSLEHDDDAQRSVEQRTSKSAMVGLLASLTGGGPGGGADRTTGGGVRSAAGTVDPSPATKYSSPINVTATTTIRTGDGGAAASELTGRPVGQPQASGGGGTDRLVDRKSGSVILPPDSDGDGVDNWWKASNRVGDDVAPAGSAPDDGAARFRDDPYAEDAMRVVDRPRPGEISVSRTPAADEDAAPPGFDAKRSEAEVNLDPLHRTAAPPADPQGDGSGDRMHHWKYEPSLRQEAPPAGDWDGDGDDARAIKIEIGAAGQRAPGGIPSDDSPPVQTSFNTSDAFLTVEDE